MLYQNKATYELRNHQESTKKKKWLAIVNEASCNRRPHVHKMDAKIGKLYG